MLASSVSQCKSNGFPGGGDGHVYASVGDSSLSDVAPLRLISEKGGDLIEVAGTAPPLLFGMTPRTCHSECHSSEHGKQNKCRGQNYSTSLHRRASLTVSRPTDSSGG